MWYLLAVLAGIVIGLVGLWLMIVTTKTYH